MPKSSMAITFDEIGQSIDDQAKKQGKAHSIRISILVPFFLKRSYLKFRRRITQFTSLNFKSLLHFST